ncbi:Eukaryotic translation initiation factor 3 subunit F [Geranomyces michiganensis]|nr:Eukaryotic translation initiation factor 3 subunit F [Geranomyces michiganensis]
MTTKMFRTAVSKRSTGGPAKAVSTPKLSSLPSSVTFSEVDLRLPVPDESLPAHTTATVSDDDDTSLVDDDGARPPLECSDAETALIQDVLSIYSAGNSAAQVKIVKARYAPSCTYEDPLLKVKGQENICAQFHSMLSLFPTIEATPGHTSNPAARTQCLPPTASATTRTLVVPNTQLYRGAPQSSWVPPETLFEVITTLEINLEGKIVRHRDVWINKGLEQRAIIKKAGGAALSAVFKLFKIPLVDTDHLTSMYALHQRAAPRETIVGWYATGSVISPSNVYIQEFFANETAPHSPVHLLVDPTLNPDQQIASTYVANAVGVPGAAHGQVFVPVPCKVRYSAAEKSSLDLMTKNTSGGSGVDSKPLVSDMDALEETVEKVLEMVERVKAYVDGIVGGKESGHKALGRYLMDMVESVPVIEPKEFEKVFNEHLQDMLMVVYLANLTRTQLAIAERLHKMV